MAKLFLAALFAVLASVGAASTASASEKLVTLGTANVTGVYFPAGGAICRMFNTGIKLHGTRCVVESTDGSLFNLESIKNGTLDMGITQSDWQYHAYHGTGDFTKAGPNKDLRSVFSLHSEPFTIVARRDAKIDRFDDLKGKRLNIGNPGSGMRATMEMVMRAYGWQHDDFKVVSELKAMDQGQALCNDVVDAIVYTAGHPNGAIQEVTSRCPTKLINVTGPVIDTLMRENPFYSYVVIPGGMYKGSPRDTVTFGVKATLVTSAQEDPEVVYNMVKAVFDHFDDFKTLHPVFSTLDKARMVFDGNSAPLHEGAVRYFRQTGLYDMARDSRIDPAEVLEEDVVKKAVYKKAE